MGDLFPSISHVTLDLKEAGSAGDGEKTPGDNDLVSLHKRCLLDSSDVDHEASRLDHLVLRT